MTTAFSCDIKLVKVFSGFEKMARTFVAFISFLCHTVIWVSVSKPQLSVYTHTSTLRTRLRMGVCETLRPDVVEPEALQNYHSYVCEHNRPNFESVSKNLAWWVFTRRTSKITTLSKLGGGSLPRGGRLHETIQYTYMYGIGTYCINTLCPLCVQCNVFILDITG